MPKESRRARLSAQAGLPPTEYGGSMYSPTSNSQTALLHNQAEVSVKGAGGKTHGTRRSSATQSQPVGFNMKAVIDVLTEHELNPAHEIAQILKATREVRDAQGNPVLNPDGSPVRVPVLDEKTRLAALMGLQEYVAPKLKAVEVTHKEPPLTEDQIDARLRALLTAGLGK